jgi:hypothetical protein
MRNRRRSRKSEDRLRASSIFDDRVFIKALRIENRALWHGDGDDARAFGAQELRGVVPDIAEALDDDALAVESR